MKILIADDDRVFVELLSSRLRRERFNVLVAFDAAQAMLIAMREKPDAMVLDVHMPGGSGLDTLRKLKTLSRTAMIPIIVVTSLEDPATEERSISAGAHEFIRKPASFDEVHGAFRTALLLDAA